MGMIEPIILILWSAVAFVAALWVFIAFMDAFAPLIHLVAGLPDRAKETAYSLLPKRVQRIARLDILSALASLR